jgi:cyanophycinase
VIISGDSISSLLAGTRFFSSPRDQFLFRKEGGLALLNMDYVIDSHLSEKGREMRTIRTLLESNITRGIGVDENTALVVNNPLTMPVGKV